MYVFFKGNIHTSNNNNNNNNNNNILFYSNCSSTKYLYIINRIIYCILRTLQNITYKYYFCVNSVSS